jgi:mono/diheme cytochrome c family protein
VLKSFVLLCSLLMLGASPQQPAAPDATPALPKIPAADAAMVNPVKPNPVLMSHAKKMYGYDCAICHGATGDGKGDVAMTPPVKDWTDPAALKDMTDGELFYIIKNGRGQMTGEGDRVKPDELWAMVIMVRSFAKK